MNDTATAIEKQPRTPLAQLKQFVNNPQTQQRLSEMLGDEAGTFANSIINLFNASFALQKCDPASVMSQAMIAASLRLPIDPALGYAAIVPYGKKAQFQLMYRGVIQLCLRSGQYESIYDTEVYRDELESYNPITGEVRFKPLTEYKMRPQHNFEDVVGFYCRFRLLNGFNASLYMTKEEVLAHAERYSQSYQRDLRHNKKTSAWSTHPIAMGRKTVILALLTRYGIMSVEMREAFRKDLDTQEYRKSVESRELKPTNGRREKFGFDEDDDTDDPYSSDQDEDDADLFAPDDERPEQADSSTDVPANQGEPVKPDAGNEAKEGQPPAQAVSVEDDVYMCTECGHQFHEYGVGKTCPNPECCAPYSAIATTADLRGKGGIALSPSTLRALRKHTNERTQE